MERERREAEERERLEAERARLEAERERRETEERERLEAERARLEAERARLEAEEKERQRLFEDGILLVQTDELPTIPSSMPQALEIPVPSGARPGDKLKLYTNEGGTFSLRVPDNAEPGMVLMVKIPAIEAEALINVSFPAGPLGFDILEVDGKVLVVSSKGTAKRCGVAVDDEVVQVGTLFLADELKNVENHLWCSEVKKSFRSFPRPLNIVFAKPLGSASNVRSSGWTDGGIEVSFPAGPLGIGIREKNGKIVVTSSSGIAKEQGVQMNDEVVQVGTILLADGLNYVEISERCREVKRMMRSFPRPLNIVFAKPSVFTEGRAVQTLSVSASMEADLVVEAQMEEKEEGKGGVAGWWRKVTNTEKPNTRI